MIIYMNWAEVGKVANDVRDKTRSAVDRVNRSLLKIETTGRVNPGFATSSALETSGEKWADELGAVIHETMIDSDKLDDSRSTMKEAEEENRRAAAALTNLI